MSSLREQIEAAAIGHYPNDWTLLRILLDIIDAHRCDERYETFTAADGEVSIRKHRCNIPDRDALARALHPATCWNNEFGCMGVEDHFDEADAIIAALEKKDD